VTRHKIIEKIEPDQEKNAHVCSSTLSSTEVLVGFIESSSTTHRGLRIVVQDELEIRVLIDLWSLS
jgi:hypothetical protein